MVQLPPVIPYVLGAILVVFGALRAYHLGWKRRAFTANETADQGVAEGSAEGDEAVARPARPGQERRHMVWGALWVAMGLFLIVSTLMAARGR